MKQNRYSFYAAFALGILPSVLHGATYFTDFESGYSLGNLDGQNGWTVNATGSQAPAVVSAVIGSPGVFGVRAGSIGYADTLVLDDPLQPDLYASYKYSGGQSTSLLQTVGNPATTFSAIFQIFDSDSGYSPGSKVRDTFGFRLQNGAGANLFSLFFTPFDQDPTPQLDTEYNTFSWSTGVGAPVNALDSPLVSAEEGQSYTFGITFSPSGLNDVAFSANISGAYFSGILPNVAAEGIAEFGAFWKPTSSLSDPGSNFMVFDGVNLVPEPSSALLGLVGASFAFLRRRRN